MNSQNRLILQEVISIIRDKFSVPESILTDDNLDKPLTGKLLRFDFVKLTYLFLELEKTFKIRIDDYHLRSYGFCSINKISEIIGQYL